MKILYIHQYFVTTHEYGGTRSYWFARELIKRGHQVTLITSTRNSTERTPGKHLIDGIEVYYIKNRYSNMMSPIQRIISFLLFVIQASIKALKEKKVDIVYATSTPLTIGLIAMILKWFKQNKFVFEVRDLWPDGPIQLNLIKNKLIIRILKFLEILIYRNSLHIVALSPGMKDGIIKAGIKSEKVTVIPNMSKPDLFFPREKSKDILNKFSINESNFNIIHFGSMGIANGLEYIIETARILKKNNINEVTFIFAGYGATETKLKKLCQEYDLANVIFVGKHNTTMISEIVNCCDASIVSFMNVPILQTNSPNKLFDSFSAGKPVIVNSAGWTKDLVERNNCGVYVDPDDPNDFVEKIIMYKSNRDVLNLFGSNARQLSLSTFDKEILACKFADLMEYLYEKYR